MLQVVPSTRDQVIRFGSGSPDRAKANLLALYGFLASKPDNTRRAYGQALREFFEIWEWRAPAEISVAEAAYYKRWLKDERELSDSTVCQRLAACQSFFDFLMKPDVSGAGALVPSNPFRLVSRKDCTPSPYGRSSPVEWSEFAKVLKAIPDDAIGKRDRAMLLFFANTGRRRAEVARLKVKDLDLQSRPRAYVAVTKGNKVQRYELSDACYAAILDHWIGSNRLSTLTPESAVFGPVNTGGGSASRDPHRCLTVDQVHKILKRNVARAGLDPKRFKLHGLRHMFAQQLDQAGARIQDISQGLGHALMNTTQIYLNRLRGPAGSGLQAQLDEIRKKSASIARDAIDV